ncbi:hypothetical protein E4T44_01440 [Aureobasidium sp. EXF-8845]|nr:hypothetical protein E4T44_01440 [Aureobasidium sp. EXF-8845]KAI4857174.1 hypothetical protein E4T45_01341 [Aureobasidium sp. EXF-8846]
MSEEKSQMMNRFSGFFNLTLAPKSFGGLPMYKELTGCDCRVSSDPNDSQAVSTNELNSAILLEFEETPHPKSYPSLLEQSNRIPVDPSQARSAPSASRSPMGYGIPSPADYLLHYKAFVSPRIMPIGPMQSLFVDTKVEKEEKEEEEEVVLSQSKSFKPLHHAVCAISALSLALRGQQNLFVEAFQHYDWAISTCLSSTHAEPGPLFYLHFILLIYDICCDTQGSLDQIMWSQHFQHLAQLAYRLRKDKLDKMQAYMLWRILSIDIQSCLTGNDEAGSCVRAYLADDSFLPSWVQFQRLHQELALEGDSSASTAVHDLALLTCKQLAELSQLALQMRRKVSEGGGGFAACEQRIDGFHYTLHSGWTTKYRKILVHLLSEAGSWLIPSVRLMVDFYSTAMVYLHTSMYPGQRLQSSPFRKYVAQSCTTILSIASVQSLGQHHLFFPLFLAGYASKYPWEKTRALELMEEIQIMGLSNSSLRSSYLLQLIYEEQIARVNSLGEAEEVDWIAISRQVGINIPLTARIATKIPGRKTTLRPRWLPTIQESRISHKDVALPSEVIGGQG